MDNKKKRQFKAQAYEQLARLGRALANPHRLEILDLLAQGERCVEDVAREAAMTIANASQHLSVLRSTRLVDVRRDGLRVYYRLADDRVYHVLHALRDLGDARLAEMDQLTRTFLHDRTALQAVTAAELLQRLEEGSAIVLDVRPAEEYCAGHIRGAHSLPLDSLQAYLSELPKDREIVAYCRGPYCVLADEAVALLNTNGYRARRLAEGFPEWQLNGLPVDTAKEQVHEDHQRRNFASVAGVGAAGDRAGRSPDR